MSSSRVSKHKKPSKANNNYSTDDETVSDTASHLGDADEYDSDGGFIVKDDTYSDDGMNTTDDYDLYDTMTEEEKKEYDRKLEERIKKEDEEFIAENTANIIPGGRTTRTRRAPKTAEDEYNEIILKIKDNSEELDMMQKDLATYKGRLTASEKREKEDIRKAIKIIKERLELLKHKREIFEENSRVYYESDDESDEMSESKCSSSETSCTHSDDDYTDTDTVDDDA